MTCGIGPQPSLRDSRPFGVQPSVETLGYSRLSLRDTKAAVFPRRQYSPGVEQYDLWVMTSLRGERDGVRVPFRCGSQHVSKLLRNQIVWFHENGFTPKAIRSSTYPSFGPPLPSEGRG